METDNMQDVIDSRDIITRIKELEDDESLTGEEKNELTMLQDVAEQAEDMAEDWEHGGLLIRDSYFGDYAQELAEDCGMIPDNMQWPCTCIDWERAARDLKMDYTVIDYDGVTYWVR